MDDRGEFWRSFCHKELDENGLKFEVCQSNVSINTHRYTLRGFHFQRRPSTEQKILTVIEGSLYVVIVDVRRESPTFLTYQSFHFGIGDRSSLLIADGCATGFQTLADNTIVHYQMSDYYQKERYTGFRYDDPCIGVEWPFEPTVISNRDRGFVDLELSSL